jgi:bifunctional DNase/RNase
LEIDSRTSDAVAIAVRYGCPIYADDKVIEATAMEEESNEEIFDDEIPVENKEISIEELEKYLEELIAEENYEEASRVRDEINRRKKL